MMKHMLSQAFALVSILAVFSGAIAQTGLPDIRPLPIYTQCASLANGTAAEAAISKHLTELKSSDIKARADAALALGTSCDARAVDPLLSLLSDTEPSVRAAAVEALGRLGAPETGEDLINLLQDPDWRVRMALISSLASFKTFRVRNMVLNGIANPSGADITDPYDMRVRCIAILTCNQMQDVSFSRKAVLFLHDFLKSRHEPIRKMAEQTMYALKDTRNGPSEFVGILKQSHDPAIRRWAAEWIGKIGIEKGRTVLAEIAANDADPAVKRAAADSLAKLPPAK
jgi:HEAT repeat protein